MATAQAQPNIALIKYWGKRDADLNLPAVDSLSVTLDSLVTTMSVSFDDDLAADLLSVNGADARSMLPRVSKCLDLVAGIDRPRARVVSASNFPVGAGLASSASAFAALVVAADRASGGNRDRSELARLAGRASGSAARSLFGGFVKLAAGTRSIDVTQVQDAAAWPLEVVVAITSDRQKPVGSGDAMLRSGATSPFYRAWMERQPDDLDAALVAIRNRDFASLAAISEHNCLKMHSLMWTSRPPVVYWNSATLASLEVIRELQAAGHDVFFTMDAGPQVKAVCGPGSADTVCEALAETRGVQKVMRSSLGAGARLIP